MKKILPLQFTKRIGHLAQNKSAILLSGGMDSVALSYWKKPKYSITVNYGQKPAQSEIQAARQVSRFLGIEHHVITVDCSSLGSGDMNGTSPLDIAPVTEWWPFRNQLIATLASMKCIELGAKELLVGSVAGDKSHIDGTSEFYSILSRLIKLQEGGIILKAPALKLNTKELIKESNIPSEILFWAHSCHTSNAPCMNCNGCKKYLYILQELGLEYE